MAVLDKLMFWKKEDPLAALDKNPLPATELPGMGHNNVMGMEQASPPGFGGLNEHRAEGGYGQVEHDLRIEPSSYPMQAQNPSTSAYGGGPQPGSYPEMHAPHAKESSDQLIAKEIEIISTKLDYLKASLENINQRLANIERIAQMENPQQRW